jgi:uncharacterized repeat protein (TIGR01451 family)
MNRTHSLIVFVIVLALLLSVGGTTVLATVPLEVEGDGTQHISAGGTAGLDAASSADGTLPAWVAQADQQGYYLTWTGSHQFQAGSGTNRFGTIMKMNGSAFVPDNWYNGSFPFFLNVTYEYDSRGKESFLCDPEFNPHLPWNHTHQRVLDSGRYSGVRSWIPYITVWEDIDGHHRMTFPFMNSWNSSSGWVFTLETFNEGYSCAAGSYASRETTQDSASVVGGLYAKLDPGELDLECDDTGSLCWRDVEKVVPDGSFVTWHLRAVRVGGCAGHTAPIDASDPVIVNHKGRMEVTLDADTSEMDPNGLAVLQAKVTCDGVPVRGATVQLSSQAVWFSGGHNHENAKYPRPDGCLNGQKVKAKDPFVTLLTDDSGVAQATFQAGAPTNEACGSPRGIAGIYYLKAEYLDREKNVADKIENKITVARQGFRQIQDGSNYRICRGGTETHPSGSWGTPQTLSGIQKLATAFAKAQEKHFKKVITSLPVNDISLKGGGLFDSGGYDVDQKKAVKWIPWRRPHKDHLYGTGVDFTPYYCWNQQESLSLSQTLWLSSTLRSLGKRYGTWAATEPGLHLEFTQTPAHAEFLRSADVPDLTVTALADRSPDRPTAAPGQQVLFAFSVDNMNGGVPANQVILTATLPPSLTILDVSPPADRNVAPGSLAWDVSTLEDLAVPELFTVTAQVNTDVVPGTVLTATAEATTLETESSLENNTDTFGLIIQAPGPDLVIDSDIASARMLVGEPVTLSLNVANYGNALAQNVALTLTLPPSVTLLLADPITTTTEANIVTWELGDIAPDDERVITATVELDFSLTPATSLDPETDASGWLTYTLATGNTAGDIDPDNNSEEIIKPVEPAGSDLMIWSGVEGDEEAGTFTAGQVVTYTLYYANYGNQVAPSTTITLSLGAGLSLAAAQPTPDATGADPDFEGGLYGWQLGELAVGSEGAIPIQIQVESMPVTGTVILATITAEAVDIQPEDNVVYDYRTAATALAQYSIYMPIILKGQ